MNWKLAYKLTGRRRGVFGRKAAAVFGVLVVLVNIAAGSLSLSHFAAVNGQALSQEGKIAICSGGNMLFHGADGTDGPAGSDPAQHTQHECFCCLWMQAASAAITPASLLAPDFPPSSQVLKPGTVQHLRPAAVPARRNRDPPAQA
jgi:Protein of unknown function (DUF2946)